MCDTISPFTDFGFKYIFGREGFKEFLIDFLNGLLAGEPGFEPITDVNYLDKEFVRNPLSRRGIICDIHCRTESGKTFIVEMQNAQQAAFIDRSIYYAARAIAEQGAPGRGWNYSLHPVYVVAFMNFHLDSLGPKVRTDVALCDLVTNEPVSDRVRFIYIQLDRFRKTEASECEDILDQWLFNLKRMDSMENLAFTEQRAIFARLEKVTSYASLSEQERRAYDEDLKVYRDLTNSINFAESKGRAEGRVEGRAEAKSEIIRNMSAQGVDAKTIASYVSLTVDEVMAVLQSK